MSIVVENPRYSCTLGGALATARNIYRTIPILHAGPGCGAQVSMGQGSSAGFQGVGYLGGNALPSSNMYEKEVIFGGEDRIRELINSTLEIMDGDLYFVLTGCTAGIIGDDTESIVNEFKKNGHPIAHAETAGFKGNSYSGYEIVFEALFNQLVVPSEKDDKTVNIFGIVPYQDINWQGNLEEITRLLRRLGIKVNSFLINKQGSETIKNSSSAALNIIISPWLADNLAKEYKAKYNIPYLRFSGLPVGPTETNKFIEQVSSRLNLDKETVLNVINEETEYVYDYLEKSVDIFTRYNFAIIGDSNTVLGLTKFLVNDYGQLTVLAIITDDPKEEFRRNIFKELALLEYGRTPRIVYSQDQWVIRNEITKASPTFILGSSLDREVAQELKIPHQSVSFPVNDRLILNHSYAGYRGCIALIEDLFTPR